MTECKAASTPAIDNGPESVMSMDDLPQTSEDQNSVSELPFLELIGCLWWMAQMTRPDIYVALQQASKWTAKPSMKLWRWLMQILRWDNRSWVNLLEGRQSDAASLC